MNGHDQTIYLVPGQVLRVEIVDHTPTAQPITVEQWQDWPDAQLHRFNAEIENIESIVGYQAPVPVYELPAWAYAYVGVLVGFIAIWWFT